ncbi:MAG TPA: LytTR family DNA-binding domain-containing protein [Polyangiales bacterium]|jgi:DNA-binding LytR/AlgR family response regulator|nr:LytTR family DNA-binding domain-containing protein [Polyangiales bacterium]
MSQTADAKLRVLIVEDEWPARNYLVELLVGSGLAEVVGAVATVEEAQEALKPSARLGIDTAFVDVQLARDGGDRAGLGFARTLRETAPDVRVVLATAYDQHAIEAFELGAVDYLLKPFGEERVLQCLNRLRANRMPASPPPTAATRIVARRRRSLVFLEPEEIWAFEADERLTFVHTRHGKFDVDLSLAAIEVSLGAALTRVHRKWLVNATHVRELMRGTNETLLFVGDGMAGEGAGVEVPVSRDRVAVVRETLLRSAVGTRTRA